MCCVYSSIANKQHAAAASETQHSYLQDLIRQHKQAEATCSREAAGSRYP